MNGVCLPDGTLRAAAPTVFLRNGLTLLGNSLVSAGLAG